ncbi:PREDICTED: sodium/glucose cotransporter 1-like [Condylura cristata]|uniref:sodium/glucose cotransporter 1-like n=1 Tax=Condylura cristata TaxID=143302 RepID=UPI000643442E|nr:PREDICTED: sodium/glucose cotransporter 1-like [Condylura cristata]
MSAWRRLAQARRECYPKGKSPSVGRAFEDVGGYQELRDKYIISKPTNVSQGNWTANSKCYMPRRDSYHVFRDPLTGDIPWPGLFFGVSILNLYRWCASQISVQRCLAGKSIYHVKSGCVFCGYLSLLPMFIFVMPGMISRILYPDTVACAVPSHCAWRCGASSGCSFVSYPLLVVELLPTGVLGVMLSALWGSLVSSLTSNLNCATTLFTLDIYTQMRPAATEKELMVTGRFFVIVLFAITITWATLMQTAYQEQVFELVMGTSNYLAAPIAALVLLAVFCKRVTEQGAFWGLLGGLVIGLCVMALRFVYRPQSCTGSRSACPGPVCDLNYLYVVMVLFAVSLLLMLGISSCTKPVPDQHLRQLCWSLRHSPDPRVCLDAEVQRKRCVSQEVPEDASPGRGLSRARELAAVLIAVLDAEQAREAGWRSQGSRTDQTDTWGEEFKKGQGCFWMAWDIFCGLKLQPSSRVSPEEASVKETRSHSLLDTAPDQAGERPEGGDVMETSPVRKIINGTAVILLLVTVLCHIYYF